MLVYLNTDNTWNIYVDTGRAKAEDTMEDPIMLKNQMHIININNVTV